jgi:cytochrome c553
MTRAFALTLCLAGAAVAAPAPPQQRDTMTERAAACTTCHGKEGRATNQGYFPRIAGKPAVYLYNQLVNFREGRRHYAAMTYLVEHLNDAYLMEISQYFAALDLPYPPPQALPVPPALLARGEALVKRGDPQRKLPSCASCHGEKLTGVQPALPGILGLPRDYLIGQLGAWQTGVRRAHAPDCMRELAMRLTPEDVGAVSAWLAAQPVPADAKPVASLPAPLPTPCGGVPK